MNMQRIKAHELRISRDQQSGEPQYHQMMKNRLERKLVDALYLIHVFYLISLPGLVNFILMVDGPLAVISWMNPLVFFLGNAFMMAVYLGVVTELKSFPDKLWKAIYFVLSAPIYVFLFVFLGKGDLHDYFLMSYFGVVLGVAFFAISKTVMIGRTGSKTFLAKFKDAAWPMVFFAGLFCFCIWFLLHAVHAEINAWSLIGFLGLIVGNNLTFSKLLKTGVREQHDRAVTFILIGVFLWLCGFIVGGILAPIIRNSV